MRGLTPSGAVGRVIEQLISVAELRGRLRKEQRDRRAAFDRDRVARHERRTGLRRTVVGDADVTERLAGQQTRRSDNHGTWRALQEAPGGSLERDPALAAAAARADDDEVGLLALGELSERASR